MTTDLPRNFESLLEAALALPVSERTPFLEANCPSDAERQRLHKLLANSSQLETGEVAPRILRRDLGEIDGNGQAGIDSTLAPATERDAEERLPARLGPYNIVRKLGQGGMGIVYEGLDSRIGRPVALKTILPERSHIPDVVERLRNEAAAIGRLKHPHIIALYEFSEYDGVFFLVMELIDGERLKDKLAISALPPETAAEFVHQAAFAVDYAHQQGILHRDLKPENILVDREGQAKVGDFGLARCLDADVRLTLDSQPMGTPAYMSPEQAEGKMDQVDVASDVYSLGATLYALLTSRPPFQAATPHATLQQVCTKEPVPPRDFNRDIPIDLNTICLKCLAKEPRARYATARELGEELQRYLEGRPILARPIGAGQRFWRWCRRNPALSAASGAAALAICLGTIFSVAFGLAANQQASLAANNAKSYREQRDRADDLATTAELRRQEAVKQTAHAQTQEQIAKDNLRTADEARADAVRERELAERRRYVADMRLAFEYWHRRDFVRVRSLVGDYDDPSKSWLRTWEWHYLASQTMPVPVVAMPETLAAAWSPSEEEVVCGGVNSLVRHNVNHGQLSATLYARQSAPSADQAKHVEFTSVAWSSDGKFLFGGTNWGEIWQWNADDNSLIHRRPGHAGRVAVLEWSETHSRLASSGTNGEIKIWTGDLQLLHAFKCPESKIVKPPPARVTSTSVTRAQKRAGWFAGGIGGIGAKPTGELPPTASLELDANYAGCMRWSPTGDSLAVGCRDGSLLRWSESGAEPKVVKPENRPISQIAWVNDDQLVLHLEPQEIISWSVSENTVLRRITGSGVDCLPKTGIAVYSSSQDTLETIRMASGVSDAVWIHSNGQGHVRFSPSGRKVLALPPIRSERFRGPDSRCSIYTALRSSYESPKAGILEALAWIPNRDELAIAGAAGLFQFDTAHGEFRTLELSASSPITAIVWSPVKETFLAGCDDGNVRFQALSNSPSNWIAGPKTVECLAVCPQEPNLVATANTGKLRVDEARIEIWDLREPQKPTAASSPITKGLYAVAWHPTKNLLAAGGPADSSMRSYGVRQGGVQVRSTAPKENVYLWNRETNAIRSLAAHLDDVTAVSFSPDGRWLASAGKDESLVVWTVDGERRHTLLGHSGAVYSLAWSPDSKRLASGGEDGIVRLWDPELGVEITPLANGAGTVTGVSWNSSGNCLAACSATGLVRLWRYERP